MLTRRVVIQCPDIENARVRLYQNFDLSSSWSFENSRAISTEDYHKEIFPFTFNGNERFTTEWAGPETRVLISPEGSLLFSDDYGVPEGFLIGILFPKYFVPEVFKFKSKPHIPVGSGRDVDSIRPPGHIDILLNSVEKRAAVVFHINTTTLFGFKCIASRFENNFPANNTFPFYNDLFATIGFEESHPISISVEDILNFKDHLKKNTDFDELKTLLTAVVSSQLDTGTERTKETTKIDAINAHIATSASAISISDSYLNNGIVGQLVGRLLAYAAL